MFGGFDTQTKNKEMKQLSEVLHYYLPYKLKCQLMGDIDKNGNPIESQLQSIEADSQDIKVATFEKDKWYFIEDVFPVLHPLSSIIKDDELWNLISYNTKSTILREDIKDDLKINAIRFGDFEELLRHHIDIFDLIESGQAIEKTI